VLNSRTRPCLQYQIKRCPGPCVFPVSEESYGEQVEDVMMFLGGKSGELVERLHARMAAKSAAEEFESAAQLRDSIDAVERSLARQDVVQDQFIDQDVFGLHRDADVVELVVLFIRAGKLVGRRRHRATDQEFPDAEVMAAFVQQYYASGTFVPDEVIVPMELPDSELLIEWLSAGRRRKVKIISPKRGMRTRLVTLASRNAAASAASRDSRDRDARAALEKLQKRLRLKHLPRRIECIDIAHIQGASTVASLVVFVDGVPENSLYRHFKIKSVTNDDFAAMYEVVTRRFRRALVGESSESWEMPDLLVIDGGKGQLGSAVAALEDLGVSLGIDRQIDVIGLAKERETNGDKRPDRVFLRNIKDPIALRPNTTELYLLARIRDEAHRFANTFHRKQRKRSTLRSALDDIPGVGSKRRKQLLTHFGSLKAIRGASVEELAGVDGINRKVAEAVHQYFVAARDGAGGKR
jgi:excinuclease ABC subunit C